MADALTRRPPGKRGLGWVPFRLLPWAMLVTGDASASRERSALGSG